MKEHNYITHLHAFRGFAILGIVGAHVWSLMINMVPEPFPEKLFVYSAAETVFHGSTLYFALISGLLFSLVLKDKGWGRFYKSKLLNVFLPYAAISFIFLAAFWPMYVEWFKSTGKSTNFLIAYGTGILEGSIQLHFWYIPVLAGLYVVTPFLYWLMNHKIGLYFFIAFSLIPFFISRSLFPNLLSVQTAVYFFGVYSLGMLAGAHYGQVKPWLLKYRSHFVIIACASTSVVLLYFLIEFETDSVFSIHQALIYLQKLSFAALALSLLLRFEERIPSVLMTLGSYSFAIFFLHFMWIVMLANGLKAVLGENYNNVLGIGFGGFAVYLGSLAASVLLAFVFKKIFRKYSRMIVGV